MVLDKTDKEEKILVFDLGGGTFDVSILELGEMVSSMYWQLQGITNSVVTTLTKNHRLLSSRIQERKWYRLVNRQDGPSTFERCS